MSKIYSINTVIDFDLNLENIQEILNRGKRLGFQYYLSDFHVENPLHLKKLTINQTCGLILEQNEGQANSIQVNFENTYFTLYILSNPQGLEISFSGFHYYPWMRKFDYSCTEDLDIFGYIQLLLKLIEPYKILTLNVEKE